ncbi:MAG TPA: M17 family peptidase N-terminal domain-containing protein, partial [bacterium]
MIQFSVLSSAVRSSLPKTSILLAFENESGFLNAPGKEGVELRKGVAEEGFAGKVAQAAVAYPQNRIGGSKVIVLGLGPKEGMTVEILRRAGGRLARKSRELRVEEIFVEWPRSLKGDFTKAFVEGVILGSYQYTRYKTQLKDVPKGIQKFTFKTSSDVLSFVKTAAKTAENYCSGVLLARDLINGAPSDVTPKVLADTARKIAKGPVRLKLYGKSELKRMGAGGILGVNIGSAQEPYLIHLHYKPTGKPKKSLAIVGKGITFDSGGLSLKPAGSMETMKMDMSGAAAVLGVFSQ